MTFFIPIIFVLTVIIIANRKGLSKILNEIKIPNSLLSVLLPISTFANTKLPKDKFEDALFERDMEIAKSFQDLSNDPQNGINTCYTYTLLKEKHEFVKKILPT